MPCPPELTTDRAGTRRFLHNIWQPLGIFLLTTVFTTSFFAAKNPLSSAHGLFFCNADGSVQPTGTYNLLWDSKLYFTINMSMGKFSFTAVKVIDACWDTVVGRGGQMLAGIVAYRVLRRSIALSMEICTYPISTVTAIFCQEIQLKSAWTLLRGMHTRQSEWHYIPWASPYIRLVAHTFVCAYVLSFATLVSVMAGYRAELKGYFGTEEKLMAISEVFSPQLGLSDGARVGLPEPSYFPATIPLAPVSNGRIDGYLNISHSLGEPLGALFDYYATCVGVLRATRARPELVKTPAEGSITYVCADHECSCSVPVRLAHRDFTTKDILSELKSNITINGKHWELPAPPLNIGVPLQFPQDDNFTSDGISADAIWYNKTFYLGTSGMTTTTLTGEFNSSLPDYVWDDTEISEHFVTATGRCVSQKAYSWGFSSLLLLTFCCDTILFAAVLLALEFDIHRHGRSSAHESHSIYKDVLFLADELQKRFGDDVASLSTASLERKVAKDKKGIGLETPAEQQLSRRQISHLAVATERWEQQLAAEAELREATQFTRLLTAARNARTKDDGGAAMAEFEDYLRRKESQAMADPR